MCLPEKYNRVCVGKNSSDSFLICERFETRRCSIIIAIQLCFRVRHQEDSGKPGWREIKWYTSACGLY